jgi:hypothetical protein
MSQSVGDGTVALGHVGAKTPVLPLLTTPAPRVLIGGDHYDSFRQIDHQGAGSAAISA